MAQHDGQPTDAGATKDAATPRISAPQRSRLQHTLLGWYAANGRDLPWRHTRDPYAVLVSEIMLQQTQVDRVLPKYDEFLRRFPTLAALAAAPLAEVIRAWAPLGYNVRAVRLHQIACQARECFDGALPGSLDGLLALKGIGRYTAGAIACFAFGLPVATVDTNIRRVLWRVLRGIEPPTWPSGQAAARTALALAQWALPPDHAYAWQQALMDLGATVCVSRRPACERCPLMGACAAYAEIARVTLFPSGEALTRLRDTRAAQAEPAQPAIGPAAPPRVAESATTYATTPGNPPSTAARGGKPRQRRAATPFTSTSRYFRGRALAALRAAQPGAWLTLRELGPLVKADWTNADLAWLRDIVAGLARDGLLRIAGSETSDTSAAALRVALP